MNENINYQIVSYSWMMVDFCLSVSRMKEFKFLFLPLFCFLYSVPFSQSPTFAEEKPYTGYKEWSDLSEKEKEGLRARWTDEKVAEVVKALKGGKFTRVRGETPLIRRRPWKIREANYYVYWFNIHTLLGIIYRVKELGWDEYVKTFHSRILDWWRLVRR